ncbi:MAG: glycerol kinase GlpK [Firmicutes bacterium]|nr:glycerol kinase GlpK [Bacillota bacterium]
MRKYILAIDQGTTGTTAIIFDDRGRPVCRGYQEFTQYYPQPGLVEHDPEEIWRATIDAVQQALYGPVGADEIAAIGITNQRETTVAWNRETHRPEGNAVVWQCRRTAPMCQRLKEEGYGDLFHKKTGLVLDPYFSGTKMAWMLANRPGLREKAEKGEVCFGTIDSWLIWCLTGGKRHVTDYTNASRTLLYNISRLEWDQELLEILDIPSNVLPEVLPSCGLFGVTDGLQCLPDGIPIYGVAGDQQAALFGQCCFQPGMVKNTYGTGCFVLMNTGNEAIISQHGLLTTIAWGLEPGQVTYALEGSVFIAGAVIQWLRDELGILEDAAQSEAMALGVPDTAGVYLVPAFVGLGTPHWDPYARGVIVGLTRGVSSKHLVRAALESIAYQSRDVLLTMEKDAGMSIPILRVDGGASVNNFLMQFQADIMDLVVERPRVTETTAMGSAFLAGLGSGLWSELKTIAEIWEKESSFSPVMDDEKRENLCRGWERAVERSLNWIEH